MPKTQFGLLQLACYRHVIGMLYSGSRGFRAKKPKALSLHLLTENVHCNKKTKTAVFKSFGVRYNQTIRRRLEANINSSTRLAMYVQLL